MTISADIYESVLLRKKHKKSSSVCQWKLKRYISVRKKLHLIGLLIRQPSFIFYLIKFCPSFQEYKSDLQSPWILGERAEAGVRKEMTSIERRTGFNLKVLWDFEGKCMKLLY